MTESTLLEHVARTIVDRFPPKRIVLFGSHARGDAGSDSNLDVVIEMQTSQRPPERTIEVSAAFGLRPWPLDVVIYTPEEVQRLRGVSGTLWRSLQKREKFSMNSPESKFASWLHKADHDLLNIK